MAANISPSCSHTPRIPALDGLRGLAILMVMIHHFAGGLSSPTATGVTLFFSRLTGLGWCGVRRTSRGRLGGRRRG